MPKLDFNSSFGKAFQDLGQSQKYKIFLLDLDDVIPNEANCYDVNDLDLLAESIKEGGLLTVIEVYEEDNRNILLSGHRRLAACKKIIEDGGRYSFDGEDITGKIPAVIKSKPSSDTQEVLHLISANHQRDLSDDTKHAVIDVLNDLIENNSDDFRLEKGERRALRIADYTGYSINYVKTYLAEKNKQENAKESGDDSEQTENDPVKENLEAFAKVKKKVAKFDKDISSLLETSTFDDAQKKNISDKLAEIVTKCCALMEKLDI